MVEMKPSILKKPKEDKTVLLNTSISSEIQYAADKRCSACCMFVSTCLFIIYLCLVILLSWILRGYIYIHLKRYLHIESIHELVLLSDQNIQNLALQSDQQTYSSINHPSIVYELNKKKPEPFELNIKTLDNGDNSVSRFDLDQIEYSIIQSDQSMPEELDTSEVDNDDKFTKASSRIIETDELTGIINNMSDFIISELELVEKTLKSNAQKRGDNSINMDDIDLFSDHIISNLTNILEEEIKYVEESFQTSKDHKEKEFKNKNFADHNAGFMGFIAAIFKHTNERESIGRSHDIDNSDAEYYDPYAPYEFEHHDPYAPYEFEHRFDLMEPAPEPESNHNHLEESEDVILNTAAKSIRNLFGVDKNIMSMESYPHRVLLVPEEQHLDAKLMFLAYLEIFGIVLAVMSLVTFILLLIVHICMKMSDKKKVIKRYKLQETSSESNRNV